MAALSSVPAAPAASALHTVTDKSVLFWHAPSFGNWTQVKFHMDGAKGVVFTSSEQAFMYWKAVLFADAAASWKILGTNDPKQQKLIGRQIKGFREDVWQTEALPLMVRVLEAKFEQNPEWATLLLDTGDRQLVEASPLDKLWGVGMTAAQVIKAGEDPAAFKGKNWLGLALQTVRATLRTRNAAATS